MQAESSEEMCGVYTEQEEERQSISVYLCESPGTTIAKNDFIEHMFHEISKVFYIISLYL